MLCICWPFQTIFIQVMMREIKIIYIYIYIYMCVCVYIYIYYTDRITLYVRNIKSEIWNTIRGTITHNQVCLFTLKMTNNCLSCGFLWYCRKVNNQNVIYEIFFGNYKEISQILKSSFHFQDNIQPGKTSMNAWDYERQKGNEKI